jgi:hypothetical protein
MPEINPGNILVVRDDGNPDAQTVIDVLENAGHNVTVMDQSDLTDENGKGYNLIFAVRIAANEALNDLLYNYALSGEEIILGFINLPSGETDTSIHFGLYSNVASSSLGSRQTQRVLVDDHPITEGLPEDFRPYENNSSVHYRYGGSMPEGFIELIDISSSRLSDTSVGILPEGEENLHGDTFDFPLVHVGFAYGRETLTEPAERTILQAVEYASGEGRTYVSSGKWISDALDISRFSENVTRETTNNISWEQETPEGTSLKVFCGVSATDDITDVVSFEEVTNGGAIPGIENHSLYLFVKIELATDDETVSPRLEKIQIELFANSSMEDIQLIIDPFDRFKNAEGEMEIEYVQSNGNLLGEGGGVQSFVFPFTPDNLKPVPNPYMPEHLQSVLRTDKILFTKIQYVERDVPGDKVEVAATIDTLEFLHVNVVNP